MTKIGIERHTLWSDSVFEASFDDVDNDSILEFYNSITDKGVKRSNVGGWQYDVKTGECAAYDDVMDKCVHVVNHIFNDIYGIEIDVRLANSWLNSNNIGDSNCFHTHPGSLFSGVYYINASKEKGNGSINFIRNDHHTIEEFKNKISGAMGKNSYLKTEDKQFASCSFMQPKQGHAYLFPPWFGHEVRRNYTESNRLVIGMNFNPL